MPKRWWKRPRLMLLAICAEAMLAVVWATSDTAGGGIGCVIG